MSQDLRFDGKVVVVTGAGNGLGRSHALEFARRGAKVVVNDLGGSHTGEGKSQTAAQKVVDEIKAAGGEAVANYDSVEDGDKIVKTAIDTYGRIDVLVNNAGILRDVSFQKMTDADWDLVYRVHVKGAYKCTHAAWPYMRDQKFGRVIMTASAAGIYGNFGQANYAMAKLGVVGFANTLAVEGRKNNVIVNTIAPVAGSRMTETVLPQNLLDALKPEYVTALVIELCHESHEDTGGLYEVGGGFYGKLRWERTKGKMFRLGRPVSAEDVHEAMKEIDSFEAEATHPAHIAASLDPIMKNVEAGPSKGGNQFIDVDQALGYQFPDMKSAYDERDLALYALGVGAARDPNDDKDLQLVYEMHGSGFKAFPTYGVIPAINCILTMGKEGKSAPGMKYGLDRVLHGEQYLELVRPLPPKQKLVHKAKVKDIWDKGSDGGKKGGAVVITAIDTYDEDGDLLIKNEVSTFVRGAGGWGGDRGPSAEVNVAPDRKPDATVEQKIDANQALLYRLSGDWNPLHADPGFAKAFGFERPILHGLCTFGYAARHVLKSFAKDGDPRYFKSIKVRFADPVLPGETVVTEMWKESDTKIVFRVKSKERDKVVISNAAIELFSELPKPKEKKQAATASAGGAAAVQPNSADVFAGIQAFVQKHGADAVGQAKTIFAFKLKSPDSVWTLDLKNGAGLCAPGEPVPAECTFEISDADFLDMVSGKADAMKLFTTGKLKISGNVMASQKLGPILKKVDPNDVLAAAQKRAGGAAGAGAAAPAAAAQPNSADVFAGIEAFVKKSGADAVGQAKTVFAFKLKDPDSVWTLDLKNGSGLVAKGEPVPAECTFELSDSDFMDMVSGKADPMKLFTTGKLKISGNVMASQKLGPILKKVDPNDVMAAAQKRGGGAGAAAPAGGGAAAPAMPSSADVFGGISQYLQKKGADAVAQAKTIFAFKLKSPDSVWTLDLKNGNGACLQGEPIPAECTFELSDADFMDMVSGKADPMKLFTTGKLKISGNVMASQKLGPILKNVDPKDVEAAMKSRGGASAAPAAAAAAPASSSSKSAQAPAILEKLGKRIAENGGLVKEVGAVIELRVKDPDDAWTIDLKDKGTIGKGTVGKADAVITIADADLVALASGAATAQSLYQHGKLRLDGDARVAPKLSIFNKLA